MITGAAGFIGFHSSKAFLVAEWEVIAIDNLDDYYSVSLKKDRIKELSRFDNFSFFTFSLTEFEKLHNIIVKYKPAFVLHLAAQAGVRYSLEQPKAYIDANIVATFNLLEAIKDKSVYHAMFASSSSVYGANTQIPFTESDQTETPLSLYAATKKSCEVMSHAYSHLFNIPITMLRFFTVYGPWGRPDMALFKFTQNILEQKPIDIYNKGEMLRDFTYIDDLIEKIYKLSQVAPHTSNKKKVNNLNTVNNVAPFRVINLGNQDRIRLLDFISALEDALKVKAKKNFLPLQRGDVPNTISDSTELRRLIGNTKRTNFRDGIINFVEWYKNYYG